MIKKTDIIFRLISCLLIQLFVFSNVCFAGNDYSDNTAQISCLAPALRLGQDSLSSIYLILKQAEALNASLKHNKENGHYKQLIERLTEQVGSADELLEAIRVKYYDEFAQAIDYLKEREKRFIEHDEAWVIEHQKEVMLMSYCMGKILGLTEHHIARIAVGARFHDIGKCEVDPLVINDDRLFSDLLFTVGERELMRDQIIEHSVRSYDILRDAGIKDELALSVAFFHHANIDGSGYPDPVTRQNISLGAKIARVADSFSAMLGTRPYPRHFQQSFENAVADIEKNIYSLYGPRAVKTFMYMLSDGTIKNRHNELYTIPLREGGIFRELLKAAQKETYVYPFAKVACGISTAWNKKPYHIATNSIGAHRHSEINLILSVLDEHLRSKGLRNEYKEQLRRLEFLAYTEKLNQSPEALALLSSIMFETGNPFKGKVVYITLRPCASCLELLAFVGVRQIYYASEHRSQKFIEKSEKAVKQLREKGLKISQAYYHTDGVLEPNGLFFAFANQPGYEQVADTINSWFSHIINHNDEQRMPKAVMKQKAEEFTRMMDNLLKVFNADSDLKQVNAILLWRQEMENQGLDNYSMQVFAERGKFIDRSI